MKHLSKLLKFDANENLSNLKFDENFNAGLSLKKLRLELGIKQKDIYDGQEITQSYVSNLEQGVRYPDLDTLMIYSEVLKIDHLDILVAILDDYDDYMEKKIKNLEQIKDSLEKEIAGLKVEGKQNVDLKKNSKDSSISNETSSDRFAKRAARRASISRTRMGNLSKTRFTTGSQRQVGNGNNSGKVKGIVIKRGLVDRTK